VSLRQSIVARAQLGAQDRERMFALMALCYDNVERERFLADLDHKHSVIVMRDRAGVLQGFSTIRMAQEQLEGRRVKIMFSGDTVIHPDHWGTKALQRGFLSFVMREKLREPRVPLYWLLLSKGYRTYLLLTNNFPVSFPRRDYTPSSALVALRDRVARAWWGDEYDVTTEILRFTTPRDRVKAGVAPVDTALLENADIAFFLTKNPGAPQGDELVCLAEVDFGLPVRFTLKQLGRLLRPLTGPLRART
jgi:hypothetical protein